MTERPPWWFDEPAHAGGEHGDPDYVAGYDAKAAFDVEGEVQLLRELGLGKTSVLIDIGAGTGALAIAASRFCRRVVAIDVSREMLALAAKRIGESGVTNVELVKAGFLDYEHTDDPADFAYTRNALHHLPDFWKAIALTRVGSVLKPQGVLRLRGHRLLVFARRGRHGDRGVACASGRRSSDGVDPRRARPARPG